MPINSRRKGKVGELQWRDVLRSHGYASARRGRQYSGSPDSPDVVCEELKHWHFEVKCVQALNIEKAMEQARRDAGEPGGPTPVVAHKRNGKPWLVTMDASAFLALLDDAMTPTE